MPLRTLHLIAGKKLPVTLHGIRSVETVRVLVLSGHVEAMLPEAEPTLNPSSPVAIVTRITPMGQRMLQTFSKPATVRRRRAPGVKDG
jgi:hypothetical protein